MVTRKRDHKSALAALAKLAAGKPGAWVDHPWGQDVYKVGKKIFVFLALEAGALSITCKLPHSGEAALSLFSFTEPTGYGLGKSGWVSATFEAGAQLPLPMLREWIDESYQAIAPNRRPPSTPAPTPSGASTSRTTRAASTGGPSHERRG